jgi:hypothetical protein
VPGLDLLSPSKDLAGSWEHEVVDQRGYSFVLILVKHRAENRLTCSGMHVDYCYIE